MTDPVDDPVDEGVSDASTGPELTPLQRAFLALEQSQQRVEALEAAAREPIAVVGVGCRLPGAGDPDAFWQLLRDGVDAIREVPADRWDIEALYDPDHTVPGKMSTRHGGFVDDVADFDPKVFGIAPREAEAMDPQQRLALEVAWETLEHAGMAPGALAGTRTGVFVGMTGTDYAQLTLNARGVEGLGAYYASGIAHSIASGRISYVLGLVGPSITLDTACSSSLVTIHLAVQSLRSGESDLALAGGVNLILSPETSITLSKYQMMAPDGRCKFGDAAADGFVRAEGCALVALKRLADARADGDRVLAVIRGSAVNQDGASSGLTAPNGPSQEAVIRAALANAGVRPEEVTYIEAHGTGTALGDPIELQALGAVFGAGRTGRPLVVGSVKSNVGHLETAAGVGGLLKTVLMLQHGEIPPSLHFHDPSPHIPWDRLPVEIPSELRPWDGVDGRRLAGISSFGFSGTNVHVVVEQAPADTLGAAQVEEGTDDRPCHVLPLSAFDDDALAALAGRYADVLRTRPDADLGDVAHSAAVGRGSFADRLAVVAADAGEAADALRAFAAGDTEPDIGPGDERVVHRRGVPSDPPKVAFLCTGQGAQHPGMGRALYETQPVYRAALDRCAEILDGHLDHPLLDVLRAEPGSDLAALLDQTAYTQPALVAVEYALAELWRSWGVVPNAVLGHSIGEYTGAVLTGVLPLEDGLRLVATRGRLMQDLPAGGAMAAIFADPPTVEAACAEHGGGVAVAAYNGPRHVVVSGPAEAVDDLVSRYAADGARTQRLQVSHAFHSSLLEPMLAELEAAAASVRFGRPHTRLISNVSGQSAGEEIGRPGYWSRHARQPVRFADGVESLARLGSDVYLEIGPHPVLVGMGEAVLDGRGRWLPSLRRGHDDWRCLLGAVARLYAEGVAIDWRGFDEPYARRRVPLPTYPFQRDRYWITGRRATAPSLTGTHPLLGRRLRSALREVQFEQELAVERIDFLDDHRLLGTAILPGTGFIETALAAGRSIAAATGEADGPIGLRGVDLVAALAVPDDGVRAVQTIVVPDGGTVDGATVEILSQDADAVDGEWVTHARGRLTTVPAGADGPEAGTARPQPVDLAAVAARCGDVTSPDEHYARLAERGLDFGPSLRGVTSIRRGTGPGLVAEVLVDVEPVAEPGPFVVHPALLDACLQSIAWLAPDGDDVYLPVAFDELMLWERPVGAVRAHATRRGSDDGSGDTFTADLRVHDLSGAELLALTGLHFRRTGRDALRAFATRDIAEWIYELDWVPADASANDGPPATSMVAGVGPDELTAAADDVAVDLAAEHGVGRHQRLHDELEELSGRYVVRALHELGVSLETGQRFRADELGVSDAHRRLLDRLLAGLAADGVLERAGDEWVIVDEPASTDPATRLDELAVEFPDGTGELAFTRRCGAGLAGALRGDIDPLQLLFPGGSTDAAEQMYRDSPFARYYNSLAGEAVAAAAQALPEGAPLRVLEIGAGTGGTTAHVLPRLPADRTEYTFTDIGPLFVERARQTFAAHRFVEYRTLDIERSPAEQGFAPGRYDLVLATNVLHATTDLRVTFEHVADLLAPGGLLVLMEMTKPERFIDISFGLTPGWWSFADDGVRTDYLLLERDRWLHFLADAGFDAPSAAPRLDAGDGADLTLQTLLVARAPEAAAAGPAAGRSYLIVSDREIGGIGQRLGELVRAGGGDAVVDTSGDPATYERLIAAAPEGGWDEVVHLGNLDGRPVDADPMDVQAHRSGSVLQLVQALLAAGARPRLRLVTRGAQSLLGSTADPSQATSWGIARVVALEHPELRCSCIDLDPAQAVDPAEALWAELRLGDDEDQVALRTERRHVARLRRCPEAAAGPADDDRGAVQLELSAEGALDRMTVVPARRRPPAAGEVEIRVRTAGLNFRDVMNALSMRDDQDPIGSECAGVVAAVGEGVDEFAVGDAVVAVAPGCFATHVTTVADLVAPKPPTLTFEEAATIPLAFLTAHYALHRQAQIAPGETVLIHAAAGGVGLAALQLARRAGAVPMGTAGSDHKRAHLRALGVDVVMDSRSPAFADEVDERTDGRGVDVVVNSLTGELLTRSLDVLAEGGRFVELGKREALTPEQVAARPGRTYHTVPLAEDLAARPALVRPMLRQLVELVGAGALTALPVQSFALADSPAAFRYMAQARHVGKIVLVCGGADAGPTPLPPIARDDASYLVTGGLGGLGLLVAEWLVECGARHLALLGRNDPDATAVEAIERMTAQGANVLVSRTDVGDRPQLEAALASIRDELPPLAGVIHSAGVLDDGALLNQRWERFATVYRPKVAGAWSLHELTADRDLDHFVLFSSAASMFGSAGQSNHAGANRFLDALAAYRRARGLPAVSINWGPWSEIGAAVTTEVSDRAHTRGLGTISPQRGLEALAAAMTQGRAQLGVVPIDWPVFLRQFDDRVPPWLSAMRVSADRRPAATGPAAMLVREELLAADDEKRMQLLVEFVSAQVATVLGTASTQDIAERQPLHEMGLDSLMAVELRNLLGSGLGLDGPLPAVIVFDYPTVEALAGYLADEVLGGAPGEPAGGDDAGADGGQESTDTGSSVDDILAAVEGLADDEIDRLLAERSD